MELSTLNRPLRADARRNRERILAAGRELFSRDGSDVQINDIARKAGVGVGTVYRHFSDKQALLEALVAERFQCFADMGRVALTAGDRPWETLSGWLFATAAVQAEDRALCEWMSDRAGSERMVEILAATGLWSVDVAVIERLQAAGVLRTDACAKDIELIMCGVAATSRRRGNWRRHLEISLDGLRYRT